MASAELRDELNCSICLNVYTDPVTLSCGHNFCWVCIDRVLDTQERSGAYSCPDCRAVFQERPALQRNTTLCNIAEQLRSPEPKQEESDVLCTHCIHCPVPASKTCLLCEASLCGNHLRVHSKSEEHVLTEPIALLGNRKCSIHEKVLMYFCTKDASCVCVSCCLYGEHRGHQVEMLIEASEKKKVKLRSIVDKIAAEREKTEKRVQSLQEHMRHISANATGVTEGVSASFSDIRKQLEVLEKRVLSEISRQEKQVSLSVSDLIQQLEIKKDELSKKIHLIEEMCNMTDPLSHLQADSVDFSDVVERDETKVKKIQAEDLDEGLISETLHTGLVNIITGVKRGIYVQEVSDIFLDVNTAANDLHISEDLKTTTFSNTSQFRPESSERFTGSRVLSSKSFSSGRHYWEVETGETGNWRVGVAYHSIDRKGNPSSIGHNKRSWCLRRYVNEYSGVHNSHEVQLQRKSSTNRLRIYLDYEAGQLSFYELCDPIRHLHTFTATFTEALHAAFSINKTWITIVS